MSSNDLELVLFDITRKLELLWVMQLHLVSKLLSTDELKALVTELEEIKQKWQEKSSGSEQKTAVN